MLELGLSLNDLCMRRGDGGSDASSPLSMSDVRDAPVTKVEEKAFLLYSKTNRKPLRSFLMQIE